MVEDCAEPVASKLFDENNKDKCGHVDDAKWIFQSLNLKKYQSFSSNTKNRYRSQSIIFLYNFLLTFLILVFQRSACDAADVTDTTRLRKDLLNGYDKNARPAQNHNNVTNVKFNIYLKGFDFNEQRSTFTLYAWSVLTWKDEHIKWDPKLYGNLSRLHFAAHELWLPDLSVFNNLDKSEIDHFGNTRIIAYSTSTLVWVPPTKFQVGCTNDLRNWPVDYATCFVVIGSWAHDGSMLNLRLPVNQTLMDTSDLLKNREWKLIGNGMTKRDHYFECCPGVPFPDILLTFVLARESATHKAAIVVPGLAIAMGCLIAFWMRPSATERIVLLLACVINNTMYLSYIYRSLPNNGDNVPLVLLFYRDSLMMVSVALIWTVCLRYLAASRRTSPVPLPGFIQTFLSSIPAKILCLDPRPTQSSSHENSNNDARGAGGGESGGTTDTGKLVATTNPYQEDWAWLAHLFDRVAFLLYFVLYICFYLALL
ncbi:acetylcholine receptor subunit alpha-type acr-16 [Folsomia candida]|uniref:acetylcholine receptor subunit alpha-type acr-16 n=1 Tax=Folsomia candida TaxID=158441 RepID=UPI000B8F20FF|nr:acetylcholine receptor subunit alpha-type acr-16 [Folsomia candida]